MFTLGEKLRFRARFKSTWIYTNILKYIFETFYTLYCCFGLLLFCISVYFSEWKNKK